LSHTFPDLKEKEEEDDCSLLFSKHVTPKELDFYWGNCGKHDSRSASLKVV